MKSSYDPLNFDVELKAFLEIIYDKYHYDFRNYAQASMKRRMVQALSRYSIKTISALQEKVIHDPNFFNNLIQYLTISTSEMFRDPEYYIAFRQKVLPILRTYPSLKIWIAGCSTGEELYSFAIILHEEKLLDRTIIYATDINPYNLKRAEEGVFSLERMKLHSKNYLQAGGKKSLTDYYTAAYDHARLNRDLVKNIVFADHSLATDSIFSEIQFVSCRNVLIYFDSKLQNRAYGILHGSLCFGGFLGLGSKETLRFSEYQNSFKEFAPEEKIYQKVTRSSFEPTR